MLEFGSEKEHVNYVKGANIAGFVKVAEAMLAQELYKKCLHNACR